MSRRSPVTRRRSVGIGIVLLALGLGGLLASPNGVAGALEAIRAGVLAVLYVVIPILTVAALLRMFFRFNAWRG